MKKFVWLFLLVPVILYGQSDSVSSGVYHWDKTNRSPSAPAVLFEGSTHDFAWMQVTGNELGPSPASPLVVPDNEEYLFIIREGTAAIAFSDSSWELGPGSMALLLPGQSFSLGNRNNQPLLYYLFRYRSKQPEDPIRGRKTGGSFVKDFSKIEYRPHDRGGIRNYFERSTAMGKRLEMHITTLKGGIKSHEPHTHRAEEIVLMITGNTEMQIGDRFVKGQSGSLYYLGSNVLHAIRNEGNDECQYFAFQFE